MTNAEIYAQLLDLVEKSESRIDSTNRMIENLARTCADNMNMYDGHLRSLEASRDLAQRNVASSLEAVKDVTQTIALQREDYKTQLDALKKELHTLRDEYRQELNAVKDDYRRLTAAYTRLAENAHGATAEVNINHK